MKDKIKLMTLNTPKINANRTKVAKGNNLITNSYKSKKTILKQITAYKAHLKQT